MKKRGLFGGFARDTNLDPAFLTGGGGFWSSPSATGIQINQQTALQVTTVSACAQILCEDVSKMTPYLYRRTTVFKHKDKGRERLGANEHWLAALLARPNDWQTWPEFCQQMMLGRVLRGNAYAVIVRDPVDRFTPRKLVPINPDRVALWEAPNGMLFWQVSRAGLHEMAELKNEPWLIAYENMLHIKGMSANGLVGMSPIAMQREAVALALAQEQQYARLVGNGARPSGVLSTEQKLTPEAATKIRDDWETLNKGLMNSGRTAILEFGLKWTPLTLDAVDMQFLQLRQFQVQEICRMFRVPPHMVGDLSRGTFNNITQQAQEYRNNTLTSHTNAWESRFSFTFNLEDENLFVDFDESTLLKADLLNRFNAHRIGILTGFKKVNEARIEEGWDPVENGDELLQPANMIELGSDLTGQAPDGAGKPSDKVGVDNQPNDASGTGKDNQ